MPRSSSVPSAVVALTLVLAVVACGSEGGSSGSGGSGGSGGSARPSAVTPTTTPSQEWTVVPEVPLGWSVERAARRLARAGLAAERPDVDWPHYAVGTDPAAGTRVRVGTRVEVLPGDG